MCLLHSFWGAEGLRVSFAGVSLPHWWWRCLHVGLCPCERNLQQRRCKRPRLSSARSSLSGHVLSPALLRETPYPVIAPKQAATLIAGSQNIGPITEEPMGTTAPSAQPKGVPEGLEPDMLSPYPCWSRWLQGLHQEQTHILTPAGCPASASCWQVITN